MPKNIILCSDGTGNSGGKGRGTNVWRLYKAIDLHHSPAQVSIHDDGVGTRDFVLFKMLGGAFGWGLKRNVKRLRRFWPFDHEWGQPDLAPPVLIYADLLATSDARCIETAQLLYDRYLARFIENN